MDMAYFEQYVRPYERTRKESGAGGVGKMQPIIFFRGECRLRGGRVEAQGGF
jgi:hypothetical protein